MRSGWEKVPPAAEYFGVSVRTFRGWLKQGFPHSRLPSGTILIELAAGDSWLRDLGVEHGNRHIVDEMIRKLM